jgi:hypothetical protein
LICVNKEVQRRESRRRRKSECLVFREVTSWYWDCFFVLCFAYAVWR